MEKMNCSVIYDLLPLYLDGICSEDTKNMVEEHLDNCEECRKTVEYMKKNMEIPEDKDATLIKKVKRRILIEKFVIVFGVIFVLANILFFGGLHLITNQVTMNDMLSAEDVKVEEDENGDVWLVKSGNARESSFEIPEKYTEDGKLIIGMDGSEVDNYEGNKIVNVVLLESSLSKLRHQILGENSSGNEEKSLLFNANEKKDYVKITTILGENKVVLWERNK